MTVTELFCRTKPTPRHGVATAVAQLVVVDVLVRVIDLLFKYLMRPESGTRVQTGG